MVTRVRGVIIGIATLVAGVCLSGCTSLAHVSAGLHNGQVRFAYCAAFAANEVEVGSRPLTQSGGAAPIEWRATGTRPLHPGESVQFGTLPAGFSTKIGPTSFDAPKSMIYVVFKDLPAEKDGPFEPGTFDGSKLVEGKWLNWNGDVVDKPC